MESPGNTEILLAELRSLGSESGDFANLESLQFVIRELNAAWGRRSPMFWLSKRLFDVSMSLVSLTLLVPVFFLIAVAIRLESPGTIFFIQRRIGQSLRVFKIIKFRTMYAHIDARQIMFFDSHSQTFRRPPGDDDPRATKVGRWLRRWSLDELPQLVNILRGEMSFVGPRPLTIEESCLVPPEAISRYSVPAGLSGLAQISDRNIVVSTERFAKDLEYVSNLSWRQDLAILIRTFSAIIKQPVSLPAPETEAPTDIARGA